MQHYYRRTPAVSRRPLLLAIVSLLAVIGIGSALFGGSHAAATPTVLRSGAGNYCLDAYHNGQANGTKVWTQPCNTAAAQEWQVRGDTIHHASLSCLSVQADGKAVGNPIVANDCSGAPGQVWLRDRAGYLNPNSGLCLSLPDGRTGQQLVLAFCNRLNTPAEQWQGSAAQTTKAPQNCPDSSKGQRIACFAEHEWTLWQSGTPDHMSLLNSYTGGTPYEAWCADFVSYVYREAGYPFTDASFNSWDENDANKIQYLGFTKHVVGDGYVPQAGDIAYFDYNGGHVEIVVSGGKQPTFIYGNSGTTDPATGNGQMAANTRTKDGIQGQVQYFLTPNF